MLPYIARRKHAGRECVSAAQLFRLDRPALGAVFGWRCFRVRHVLAGLASIYWSEQDGQNQGSDWPGF
jgi:hypothetical protein